MKFWTTDIKKIKFWTNDIKKVFYGSTEIWSDWPDLVVDTHGQTLSLATSNNHYRWFVVKPKYAIWLYSVTRPPGTTTNNCYVYSYDWLTLLWQSTFGDSDEAFFDNVFLEKDVMYKICIRSNSSPYKTYQASSSDTLPVPYEMTNIIIQNIFSNSAITSNDTSRRLQAIQAITTYKI